MTVAELIEELEDMPPDLKVCVYVHGCECQMDGDRPVTHVTTNGHDVTLH